MFPTQFYLELWAGKTIEFTLADVFFGIIIMLGLSLMAFIFGRKVVRKLQRMTEDDWKALGAKIWWLVWVHLLGLVWAFLVIVTGGLIGWTLLCIVPVLLIWMAFAAFRPAVKMRTPVGIFASFIVAVGAVVLAIPYLEQAMLANM